MTLKIKLPLLLAATAIGLFADSYSFFGPSLPVLGDPLEFKIFSVQLSGSPPAPPVTLDPRSRVTTSTDWNWVLTVQTNYGDPDQNIFRADPTVIPTVVNGDGGGPFPIGDVLFVWNNVDYGLVLTSHDGYHAGDLYEADPNNPGFLTSGQIMAASETLRPSYPVLLAPGGSLLGAGTINGALTGDGVDQARYTITDSFTAPAGFLGNGVFTLDMSSYVCANGFVTSTPEPRGLFLLFPVILLLGRFVRRQTSQTY